VARRIRPVGAEHYIGLGKGVHRTGHVVREEHPIDPAVAGMHSVPEVVAALRSVLEVHHTGLGEVVDVVHNLVEGEEHHNLAEEEHHIDLVEGTGLVVARHMALGHSLVEADNRPAEGIVDSALVVVVDTVDIEVVVRIPGVEGLLQGISTRSSAPSVPRDEGCGDRRAVQRAVTTYGLGVVADSLPAGCNTTSQSCLGQVCRGWIKNMRGAWSR